MRMVVLDPGLGPLGGHHAAFPESLARKTSAIDSSERLDEVTFYSSEDIAPELVEGIEQASFGLKPYFESELYEFYAYQPSVSRVNQYIAKLAEEYRSAIDGELEKGSKVVFFYPAVRWEQLKAIDFALQFSDYHQDRLHVVHKICLMYNPGLSWNGEANPGEVLNYRIACKSIARHSCVQLSASDYELAVHFGLLTGSEGLIDIHPNYLMPPKPPGDESNSAHLKAIDVDEFRIGLYFGDAKSEKGFLGLPSIVKDLLACMPSGHRLIVQFSLSSDDKRLRDAASSLRELSQSDTRLFLLEGFLQEQTLCELLQSLTVLVFTYDTQHYRDKSSGFLWLASQYNFLSVFVGETWLSREARRLAMPHVVIEEGELTAKLSDLATDDGRLQISPEVGTGRKYSEYEEECAPSQVKTYREKLFSPFWPWLKKVDF